MSASLQCRDGTYRILFRFGRQQFSYSIGKVDSLAADAALAKVRNVLGRLKAHLLDLPSGMDIVSFIQLDGKPPPGPPLPPKKETTFGELRDSFLKSISNGAVEDNTLYTARIHLEHFKDTLGESFPMNTLTLENLQKHIDRRRLAGPKNGKQKAAANGEDTSADKRRSVSPVTIKKELDTLRACWNFGARMKYVESDFPRGKLHYPKGEEKLPFMTWAEIKRRVKAGGNPCRLWECLYLTTEEIDELLQYVRGRKVAAWIYVFFLCAAHTGARRSELIRARAEDVDLAGGTITLREKKRTRSMNTTRSVPLSELLAETLRDWLAGREEKPYLFGPGAKPISPQAAVHAFERALAGSKWEVMKGWHVLRHSFISALANKGVDQRIIDSFVDHQTEQQRQRYRHLYPNTRTQAINAVFG